MSIRGRWQVVETPGYDMALAGDYILFDEAGGEFAFDCLTGSIHGASHGDTVELGWHGSDEMEPAEDDGWAALQDDSSLEGEILVPLRYLRIAHPEKWKFDPACRLFWRRSSLCRSSHPNS
ncbi:hypothetical protein [Bradyrhizobium brasilense]|uniref:Uncharacterized protein n=1 Tax=Bradyrhizobium brasilense TaxID=1419277 RepID=A0ABY8JD57_9BRAD|nr:hypothetical protein [Bradyrhizobium brasilense]WFU62644.1 hypothetical protein QA636_35180 [Bradyrhizobium brasilense]